MTNPLTEQELAACWAARQKYLESDYNESLAEFMFAAALDYLRAELDKEEPVAEVLAQGDEMEALMKVDPYVIPLWVRIKPVNFPTGMKLYLRPSEPSKCPFIETSQEGTSYCRLAAGVLTEAACIGSAKYLHPGEPSKEVPEGCTVADARLLRQANHDLAAQSGELQETLHDLYDQVRTFCSTYGEADFETGRADALLEKLGCFIGPSTSKEKDHG